MIKWLRNEFTKTPGYMRVNLSLLTTLAISSVTSTSLLISQQAKSTSVESISCRRGNPEVGSVESQVNQTGRDIMDRAPNSSWTSKRWEEIHLPER